MTEKHVAEIEGAVDLAETTCEARGFKSEHIVRRLNEIRSLVASIVSGDVRVIQKSEIEDMREGLFVPEYLKAVFGRWLASPTETEK